MTMVQLVLKKSVLFMILATCFTGINLKLSTSPSAIYMCMYVCMYVLSHESPIKVEISSFEVLLVR